MAKWYVIHTLSGSEKRVKQMILEQIAKSNMAEFFEDIIVPTIELSALKKGKTVKVEKKIIPSYVLIKMKMTDESWHLVKKVPRITGFLGDKAKNVPQSLSEKEVQDIFSKLKAESQNANSPRLYEVGQQVIIIDGPFDTFTGVIEEVNLEKQRLRIAVSIFGKATIIELSFAQVKKA